jgi:hypothetical protein
MEPVALPASDPSDPSSSATISPRVEDAVDERAPRWLVRSRDKLAKLLRYGTGPYSVFHQLSSVRDERRRPQIPTADVLRSLCFTAMLRIPSLNSLEGWLKRPGFQRLLGLPAYEGLKSFSADTVSRVLDGVHLGELQALFPRLIEQAERKKVFRAGEPGRRRVVAIDGWEQFSSYHRHCRDCLTREVTVGDGEEKRTQYYHRWVVAFLLSENVEVVLDVEPLLTADRRDPEDNAGDAYEGESTAALRLLDRLHATHDSWLDLFVLDALYASGPFMTRIEQHGYGAIITLKKETDEPLKDFLLLIRDQLPSRRWQDEERGEQLKAWDVDDIETLDSFKGKIRVVRVDVRTKGSDGDHVWCAAVVGSAARRLPVRTIHRLQRSRWHLENTAFNQWTQYWNLEHVFRHTPNAVHAVMLLWVLTFDLLQLFVYRRLRRPRVPKDPCDTICAIVVQLMTDVASLRRRVPWALLLDST